MSDSGDDAACPSDHAIEQALRSIVREAVKHDEEVTIKIARTRAEEQLGLDDGFFKNDPEWKPRSKLVIEEAVEDPASPEKPNKAGPKLTAGAKRKSDEVEDRVKKRRKQAVTPHSEDVEPAIEVGEEADKELSEPEHVEVKTKVLPKSVSTSAFSSPPAADEDEDETGQNGKATATVRRDGDESDLSSVVDDPPPKKKRQPKAKATTTKAKPTKTAKSTKPMKEPSPDVAEPKPVDDESDLSSVLDDPPPKKKAARKSASTTSTKPKSAAAAKPAKELSPNEEEIKRLQSWLLKCGVRKLWHRELAPYSTPEEKIKHLKGMLDEVGLTGRYSAEKAKAIKEQRELKAELEAVEEYAQQWGKEKGEDDEDEDGKEGTGEEGKRGPKKVAGGGRLKPRGLVDFGDSGEDSD